MLSRTLAVVVTLGIILFAGWMTLRRDNIPYEQLETIYASSDSRYLALGDDMRVHFQDVGPRNAPVIVLVHGFAASLHTWDDWVADLRRDHRVISLDLPGHGLSRCLDNDDIGPAQFVDVIDRLTRALKVENFTLVGSSMGGSAAWNYTLAHPSRVDALVLVAASGWPPTDEESKNTPLAFRALSVGIIRNLIKDLDLSPLVRSALENSFADRSFVTDEMVERYASLGRAPCHREALLTLSAGQNRGEPASEQKLAAITAPVLVLHGELDNVVPAAHGQKFAAAIKQAKLKLYPGIGHLPQEEIAAQSLADLRAFLSGEPEAQAPEAAED